MTADLIRPAAPGDAEALGRLGALLVRVHHGFDPQRFFAPGPGIEAGYAAFLAEELADPATVILVAERDGVVVGYVYAGIEPHSWKELREEAGFIHDLVVAEAARGRGLAARLLEAAARELETKGASRLMLWTAAGNPGARRLFERLGFRATMVEMTRECPAASAASTPAGSGESRKA